MSEPIHSSLESSTAPAPDSSEARLASMLQRVANELSQEIGEHVRLRSQEMISVVDELSQELHAQKGTGQHLLGAVSRIDRADSQSAILTSLLTEGRLFASRTAFFLTRPGEIRPWAGQGFGGADLGGVDGEPLDYEPGSPWEALAEGRGAVLMDGEACGKLCGAVGVSEGAEGVLIPFVLSGQLAGALYADRMPEGGALTTENLQILTHAASGALERLPYRGSLRHHPALFLRGEESADMESALALWGAENSTENGAGPASAVESASASEGPGIGVVAAGVGAVAAVGASMGLGASADTAEASKPWGGGDVSSFVGAPESESLEAEASGAAVSAAAAAEVEAAAEEIEHELAEDDDLVDEPVTEEVELELEPTPAEEFFDLEEEDPSESPTTEMPARPSAETVLFEAAEGLEVGSVESVEARPTAEMEIPPVAPTPEVPTPVASETAEIKPLSAQEASPGGSGDDTSEIWLGPPPTAPDSPPPDSLATSGFETTHVPSPQLPEAVSDLPGQEDPTILTTRRVGAVEPTGTEDPTVMTTRRFDAPTFDEPVAPPPAASPPPVSSPAPAANEVVPPENLVGPGLAFSAEGPAPDEGEETVAHEEARRLARLLVSEIKLYNEAAIEEGRRDGNIYQHLRDDIDRSRQVYEERVDERIRGREDYFHQQLVQLLAGGDASLLGL